MEPKTIKIDEVEYVRKDEVEPVKIVVESGKSVASASAGMKVLVRSRNEGINCGIVQAADETGVVIKNARRLWYHKPVKGAWYESVAMRGIDDATKVSCTTTLKFIIERYSLTPCTDKAFDSIMKKVPHNEN